MLGRILDVLTLPPQDTAPPECSIDEGKIDEEFDRV